MGSTLVARRAGIKQARREADVTSNAMIAKVAKSFTLTPKSMLLINRINPKEAARPVATPIT
jgi:hypothetical protein